MAGFAEDAVAIFIPNIKWQDFAMNVTKTRRNGKRSQKDESNYCMQMFN